MTDARIDDGLPPEVSAAVQRLDYIVKRFEEHPEPGVRDLVFELLHNVDTMHRAGLKRLNEVLKVAGLQRRAVDDPEVRLLFDLYDLGEGGEQSRAEAVVESMRPSLQSVGATIELVEAEPNTLKVRLSQRPSARVAELRAAVEQALREGLPDMPTIEIIEDDPPPQLPPNFVPLSTLVRPRPLHWQLVLPLSEVPAGHLRGTVVGDTRVLLTNLGDSEVLAYRNECPGTPFPLDAAPIEDGVLLCPWHGCRFDLRGGRRVDTQAPGLGVLPVRVQDGQILVALPQGAAA
jgi:nitrite reductase/ring-hydroxylating ferredoxin subunit